MPKVSPSARPKYVLDPDLRIEAADAVETTVAKKKMTPKEQRKKAANTPKRSFKELPAGWTRAKVAQAYSDAPTRGVPKSVFLQNWNEKYDFPLDKNKATRWVRKLRKQDEDNVSNSE